MSLNASMLRPFAPETEANLAALAELLRSASTEAEALEYLHQALAALSDRPRWLPGAQELLWKGRVVKRFSRVAGSQLPVLAAFEAAGWPQRINNPPLPRTNRKGKQRRLNTIRSLNEGLEPGTICFRADGTGRGICWEEGR